MSTTTATELQNFLADYKIHLTGDNTAVPAPSQNTNTRTNPTYWPTAHRRVPDFRPIDRNRDRDARPNGSNPFEQVFLVIMFTGVVFNAVSRFRFANSSMC
jgi:hypothetical protein